MEISSALVTLFVRRRTLLLSVDIFSENKIFFIASSFVYSLRIFNGIFVGSWWLYLLFASILFNAHHVLVADLRI